MEGREGARKPGLRDDSKLEQGDHLKPTAICEDVAMPQQEGCVCT